jgi:sugar phosphate permease
MERFIVRILNTNKSYHQEPKPALFYGWIILPVAGLALFLSGPGQTYNISVFIDPIIEETGWSRTLISSIYTAGSLSASLGMIIVGRLLDKYGARIMLVLIGVLFGIALLFMGTVKVPIALYLGFAAIRTLGQGSLILIPTTLISLWFVKFRGKATALATLGLPLSQATLPILTLTLISRFGWRSAWSILAISVWILLIIPAIFIVRRSPESLGLSPDGNDVSPKHEEISKSEASPQKTDWTVREALSTRTFWLLLFAGSSQSLITTALIFHQISIFSTRGLDAHLAAFAITVMAVMSLFGNLISGYLADKFPNRYVIVISNGIILIAMIFVLYISNATHALIYGCLLGLGSGIHMNITTVIWPNYFGRTHLGSIRGIATMGGVASAALGPMPFGILFDITGNYSMSILLFVALPTACAIAAIFAKPPLK